MAIESSCDETACAIVQGGRKVIANVVASQIKIFSRTFFSVGSRLYGHSISLTPFFRQDSCSSSRLSNVMEGFISRYLGYRSHRLRRRVKSAGISGSGTS